MRLVRRHPRRARRRGLGLRPRRSRRPPARRRSPNALETGLGDAADHRRRAHAAPRRKARFASGRSAAGAGAQSTAPWTAWLGQKRNLAGQARGRPSHADRRLRDPADDVRGRAEPGRPLPLPPGRLRRLVGGGSGLALLQPLPPRPLRLDAAVSDDQRGHLPLADRIPPFRRDRATTPTRSCRAAAPGSSSTSSTGRPTLGCVSLPLAPAPSRRCAGCAPRRRR